MGVEPSGSCRCRSRSAPTRCRCCWRSAPPPRSAAACSPPGTSPGSATWPTIRPEPVGRDRRRPAGWDRWNGLIGVGILAALMAVFAPPCAGPEDINGSDRRSQTACDGTDALPGAPRSTVRFDAGRRGRGPGVVLRARPGRAAARGGADDPTVTTDPEATSPASSGWRWSRPARPASTARRPAPALRQLEDADPGPPPADRRCSRCRCTAPEDPAIESARGREILVRTATPSPWPREAVPPARDEGRHARLAERHGVRRGDRLLAGAVLFFGWCYASAAGRGSEAERRVTTQVP